MGADNTPPPQSARNSPPTGQSPPPEIEREHAIEPAQEPGDEDEFDLSEGYETGSTGSTSATSSIYAHAFEHGRRYQHFKNGRYPIPNDDTEQNREDMKHAMMMELTDGLLFYAPVENPQLIIDIGTGTGKQTPKTEREHAGHPR